MRINVNTDAILETSHVKREDADRVIERLKELGPERPDLRRAPRGAVTIGGAYAAGGAIPLAPYVFLAQPLTALVASAALTLAALLLFGYAKARFTGARAVRSALQTALRRRRRGDLHARQARVLKAGSQRHAPRGRPAPPGPVGAHVASTRHSTLVRPALRRALSRF